MDREKAKKILGFYGEPKFKVGDKTITFARQKLEDIERIESSNDEKLEEEWKSLVWLNNIYGCVSLNDMQRIDLLELEMSDRSSFNDDKREELNDWYVKAKEDFVPPHVENNKNES